MCWFLKLLEPGLDNETLLTFIAGSKPKLLHLKPVHYELLCTQDLPHESSPKDDFASVESMVVHGNSSMRPVNKQKMNAIFPNLTNYLFMEEDYYDNDFSITNNDPKENLNRRDSENSTTSGSSISSEEAKDDDFASFDSSD